MNTTNDQEVAQIVRHFSVPGVFVSKKKNEKGNVNDTIVVELSNENSIKRYTLQRINHQVFKNPRDLMDNYSRVTRHIQSKGSQETLTLIPSKNGDLFHLDHNGNYWRMMPYIEGVHCFDVPPDTNYAYQAAKAFGRFQVALSDLKGNPLIPTIQNFHNTSMYYSEYEKTRELDLVNRLKEVGDLQEFILKRKSLCSIIPVDQLPVRIVHNDTKLNNVLLDEKTGEGVSVIDLDTVMPGCALHDFGDLVRTTCNSVDEEEIDLTKVKFLTDYFESIVRGYLDATHEMLTGAEIDGLASAPLVITYELGIRFLTDFLKGDQYFKITHPTQNLERAKVQFKLLESMEKSREFMNEVISVEWKVRSDRKSSVRT